MTRTLSFRCVADVRAGTGESPLFDPDRGCLFFVDIPGRTLYRSGLDGSGLLSFAFATDVACAGLCRSGRLVLALRDSVVLFDPEAGETVAAIAAVETERDDTRLNDGKVGPDGALWVGSMHEAADKQPVAALYRVTGAGAVERKVDGLITSNGLAWSPDGRIMYHADSRGPWIDRWDFDPETGGISGRRRIAVLDDAAGRPDGGATDAQGCYWSAGVSAGVINRFSPDGDLVESHPFPVPAPTMPCFAGEGLTTLMVTSLRSGRSETELAANPQAGGLFRADTDVAGAPVHRFDDSMI